ncbi:kinesin-like protein KIN-7O isoform X2 [Selaginella moellendorffii]|uniref:kinesin-like protein KIN-7O isoform X2 n=1 Tax=Selaginella moellendorffii TaxID=88036 RepID=UPI000D1C2B64|nr:kinesin-like protein KIN-7O isoform X2 [Selaginella moellendorffii]|eukprot:XP_002988432.2 kinesin-like protein KIN-7O isoform X2 [Selaginella moellendorffii]
MEKIVVSIRVRPLSKQESAKGSPWKISSNAISLCNAATGTVLPGHTYIFDSVFGTEEKTVELYDAHTKAIISSAVKGINGTVFAYGQTSSGKTYTMRGSPGEPGIVPLSVLDVFANIQKAEDREFLLRVSYMEIYNEEINDLLAPENRKLQVHENIERGIFVAGLREEIVSCPEQVLQLLDFGEAHRHVGETNMNVYSSRSHTIFRMVIESRDRSQDDALQTCDAVRVSVLNLVDLAGSERVAKTGAEGARLKEGSHINKSLMTLGTVINKLSEGIESQGGHVPYRDSKLTRILQPALGGNARTVIICNVTPAMVHVDETKGTLQFASRAIRVTNCAQVNEIVTDAALLKRQKREIEELRKKLQDNHSEHLEEEVLSLRNDMLKIELERERMALELQNKAERERRMKEQIENLSTMVLNSAVDDRHTDKSMKKTNRRETWCPRLTSSKSAVEVQSLKANVVSNRERQLPPPFEVLKEEEDVPMNDSKEVTGGDKETFVPPRASNFVGDRRHKLSARLHANEEELLDLQARYQALHCDYEVANSEIDKLRHENEQLKATACKSEAKHTDGDRRCKSLDGNQLDIHAEVIAALQSQVETLEMEKFYMQRELDSRIEHQKIQANSAKQLLEGLHEELKESNQQIEHITTRNMQLEREKDEAGRSYVQLATAFEDLKAEIEGSMSHATGWIQELMAGVKEPVMCFEELRLFNSHTFAELKHNLTIQKDALQQQITLAEARIIELEAAALDATKKPEVDHEDECSKLKLEILALQKDLSGVKALPSEKEKDSLRKELEKSKTKLKETEAKLRTTLQDKSKLEAEKANFDRELKTLRSQSTLLQRDIDRKESLADKRRDSMACFNKAKHQLSCVEDALHQKAVDLEKTSFELQVLQGAYHEVETSLLEARSTIVQLEKQVEAAAEEITLLKEEREKAVSSANNTAIELRAATEQCGASRLQVDELQQAYEDLNRQLQERNASLQMQEEAKQDLVVELTDVYYKLEEEKAVSAARRHAIEEKEGECSALSNKIQALSSEIDKSIRMEAVENSLHLELKKLEETLEEKENRLQIALNQTVDKLRAELDPILQKVTEVEKDIEKEIRSGLEDGHMVQEFELKAESYQQQIVELETVKQKTEETVKGLKELLKSSNDTCALHAEKIVKLTDELNSKHHKLEKVIDELSIEHQRVENLSKELDCEHQKFESLKEELSCEHQKVEQLSKELDCEHQKFAEELSREHKKVENLTKELNFEHQKIGKLTDDLTYEHRKIEKLTEELTCERQKLTETLTCKHHQIEKLTEELNCKHQKLEKLQEEYQHLQASEADERLQGERTLQHNLRLEKLEATVESGEREMRTLLTSKTKLQVAFDAMSARADVFEVRLEDARWDLIDFRDKARRAQDKLESNLTAAKLEVVELKVELESVTNQLAELQPPIPETVKDASCSKRKPSELHSGITKLTKTKESDQEKLSRDEGTPRPKTSRDHHQDHQQRRPLSPLDNLHSKHRR